MSSVATSLVSSDSNVVSEDAWYTMTFTTSGTDLTCSLVDEDGTTVISITASDDTYAPGYNGIIPYFGATNYIAAFYASEYTVNAV